MREVGSVWCGFVWVWVNCGVCSGITWCSKVCGTAMGSGRVDCGYGACGMW